ISPLVGLASGVRYHIGLRVAAARLLGCTGLDLEVGVTVLLQLALKNPSAWELAEDVLVGKSREWRPKEPGIKGWTRIGMPFVLEALTNSDWQVRLRAANLLGQMGPEAGCALPALHKARDDPKIRTAVEEALLRITSPPTAERAIEERTHSS